MTAGDHASSGSHLFALYFVALPPLWACSQVAAGNSADRVGIWHYPAGTICPIRSGPGFLSGLRLWQLHGSSYRRVALVSEKPCTTGRCCAVALVAEAPAATQNNGEIYQSTDPLLANNNLKIILSETSYSSLGSFNLP